MHCFESVKAGETVIYTGFFFFQIMLHNFRNTLINEFYLINRGINYKIINISIIKFTCDPYEIFINIQLKIVFKHKNLKMKMHQNIIHTSTKFCFISQF